MKKAQTLVEVLVASVILSIFILGTCTTIVYLQRTILVNNSYHVANELLNRKLEDVSDMYASRLKILKNLSKDDKLTSEIAKNPVFLIKPDEPVSSGLDNVSSYTLSYKISSNLVAEATDAGTTEDITCVRVEATANWNILNHKSASLTLATRIK